MIGTNAGGSGGPDIGWVIAQAAADPKLYKERLAALQKESETANKLRAEASEKLQEAKAAEAAAAEAIGKPKLLLEELDAREKKLYAKIAAFEAKRKASLDELEARRAQHDAAALALEARAEAVAALEASAANSRDDAAKMVAEYGNLVAKANELRESFEAKMAHIADFAKTIAPGGTV